MNIAFIIQIGSKKNYKRSLGYAHVIRHPRPSSASRNEKKTLSFNCRKAGLITLNGPCPTVIHVRLIGPLFTLQDYFLLGLVEFYRQVK